MRALTLFFLLQQPIPLPFYFFLLFPRVSPVASSSCPNNKDDPTWLSFHECLLTPAPAAPPFFFYQNPKYLCIIYQKEKWKSILQCLSLSCLHVKKIMRKSTLSFPRHSITQTREASCFVALTTHTPNHIAPRSSRSVYI